MKRILLTAISAIALPLALSIAASAADPSKVDADNSAKNQRDRAEQTLTPVDQSSAPGDIKLTRIVRKAIIKDQALTMAAKNVKIITVNGKVTLRGPVKTEEEKKKIEYLAQTAAGKAQVVNHLEVKSVQ